MLLHTKYMLHAFEWELEWKTTNGLQITSFESEIAVTTPTEELVVGNNRHLKSTSVTRLSRLERN